MRPFGKSVCFGSYSIGLVLLTICIVDACKQPSSLVVANFGPSGNEWSAKTPHKMLLDYIEKSRNSHEFKLKEATNLVHFATRHVGHREIGFSENWFQWIVGHFYTPMMQTQDTSLLIQGRLGNCSDRCQILKSVAEGSGQKCRFVGLSGHVVLEVEVEGQWCVADPDYNVTFPVPLSELAKADGEELIRSSLSPKYESSLVDQYIRIVQSVGDNCELPVGSPLSPKLYVAERICKVLSWTLPCIMVLGIFPFLPRLGLHHRIKAFQNTHASQIEV